METRRKQFAFYPRFIIPRSIAWTSAGNIPLYLRESSATPISLPTASDQGGKKNANRALRHACRVPHLRLLMAYWWVFNNPFRFSQIGTDLHTQIRCSMLDRYVQDLSMSQQILHTCILRYVGYRVNN